MLKSGNAKSGRLLSKALYNKGEDMAYANLILTKDNERLETPIGYCFSILFFGWLVPLFRKDRNNLFKIFLILIFTVGIASVYYCFKYNKIYINDKLKEGYFISDISALDEKEIEVKNLNPVNYNNEFNQYFIWVNKFNIKYMKYFDSKQEAINYIKKHPKNSLKLQHLVKAARDDFIPNKIKEKYKFPFNKWLAA